MSIIDADSGRNTSGTDLTPGVLTAAELLFGKEPAHGIGNPAYRTGMKSACSLPARVGIRSIGVGDKLRDEPGRVLVSAQRLFPLTRLKHHECEHGAEEERDRNQCGQDELVGNACSPEPRCASMHSQPGVSKSANRVSEISCAFCHALFHVGPGLQTIHHVLLSYPLVAMSMNGPDFVKFRVNTYERLPDSLDVILDVIVGFGHSSWSQGFGKLTSRESVIRIPRK